MSDRKISPSKDATYAALLGHTVMARKASMARATLASLATSVERRYGEDAGLAGDITGISRQFDAVIRRLDGLLRIEVGADANIPPVVVERLYYSPSPFDKAAVTEVAENKAHINMAEDKGRGVITAYVLMRAGPEEPGTYKSVALTADPKSALRFLNHDTLPPENADGNLALRLLDRA